MHVHHPNHHRRRWPPVKAIAQSALSVSAAAVLLLPLASQAQTSPEGRLLASNCFQCHGTDGKGPGFDRLVGESANEIYKDLREFASGKEGRGLMAKHAMGYTDAQLRALANYLASVR